MSARIEIDRQWVDRNVLQNPAVRQALDATARRLVPILKSEALRDGDPAYAASVRMESGTRPGAKSPNGYRRPYARVLIGDPSANAKEYGNGHFPKKGYLRRAVNQL